MSFLRKQEPIYPYHPVPLAEWVPAFAGMTIRRASCTVLRS